MGHEVIRPSDFLLGDLVRAVLAVVEPLARQKNLELHLEMKDDSIRLVTDIDRARQILVNLAGNAVKFTDKGSVKILAKVDKDCVENRPRPPRHRHLPVEPADAFQAVRAGRYRPDAPTRWNRARTLHLRA